VQSADNKVFNGPLGTIFLLQTSSRKCTLSTGSPASTKDRE
jgi:hypothetical protein